jgi:flagellin
MDVGKTFSRRKKAMIINHNIAALNTIRQLSVNATNTQKALEKLSSGLRINTAADDAAGLAISEKMRGQIRGLDMAQKNAQDGISLISTAEGALNETHSILQRMRELAVQSANDTNTDDDRAQLQKEVNQLAQEISRIGKDTEFNTQKLLDGTFSGTFQIGANEDQNLSLQINDMRGFSLGIVGNALVDEVATTVTNTNGTLKDGTYNVVQTGTSTWELRDSSGNTFATSSDGLTFKTTADSSGTDSIEFTNDTVKSGTVTISGNGTAAVGTTEAINFGLQAGDYTYDAGAGVLKDSNGQIVATEDSTTPGKFLDAKGNTLFSLSDSPADGAKVHVGGIDISSQSAANTAITKIQTAIDKVSTQRSALGAYQNRLEHTINNLSTSSQNLTAAESRIRDVDMAKEMAEFTKNNILNQAAQAMLAQANSLPQGVLQLLK